MLMELADRRHATDRTSVTVFRLWADLMGILGPETVEGFRLGPELAGALQRHVP